MPELALLIDMDETMTVQNNSTIATRIKAKVDPADWIFSGPGEDRYSSDQMVGAYRAGVTTGIESAFAAGQDWIRETRERNTVSAGSHTRHVLDFLISREMHPISALLNETNFDAPEVLIILPLEEYTGDCFDGTYSVIHELEEQWREPNYAIRFSFAFNRDLDQNLLRADGFTKYHKYLMPNEQETR
jgi:hypothetical protein